MLDIRFIRENPELVKKAAENKLNKKGFEQFNINFAKFLGIDKQFREQSIIVQELREDGNKLNDQIKQKPSPEQISQGKDLREKTKIAEGTLKTLELKRKQYLYEIPNLPKSDVKVGPGESGNEIIREYKNPAKFSFTPLDHMNLGEKLDIIDLKSASKVSGARFSYLKNEGVTLEFALVQFALETLTKEGFTPIIPPVLIKKEITEELGYWQAGGNGDYYLVFDPSCRSCGIDLGFTEVEKTIGTEKLIKVIEHAGYSLDEIDNFRKTNTTINTINRLNNCPQCDEPLNSSALYLVGTAEHSIVPMHMNEIFSSNELPKRYLGFSSAFRREAGSYGKDTKGILRVHQFDKLEMVSFVKDRDDDKEHEYLLSLEEKLLQGLDIPYRVIKMGTGDLGFPVARKYDIEAWIPSQNKYRELTSVSTVTDFQSRRLNIKYQEKDQKYYVNILNGTAFAIGRTIIAIMENYQQEDGSIIIPEVLQKYMGKNIIEKKQKVK